MVSTWTKMFSLPTEVAKKLRRIEALFCNHQIARAVQEADNVTKGGALSPAYQTVLYMVKGKGYLENAQWEEAMVSVKAALACARSYFTVERNMFLRSLAVYYFQARFFTLEPPHDSQLIRAMAKCYGSGFLRELGMLCQTHSIWQKEAEVWAVVEEIGNTSAARIDALLGRSQALLHMGRSKEARDLFYRAARLRPSHPIAYEYIGAIRLIEGSDKAFYHLRTAAKLGGTGAGFYRNLFVAHILLRRYDLAEKVLWSMLAEADLACNLLDMLLLGMKPRFFAPFCDYFTEYALSMRKRSAIPRKITRFLDGMQRVVERCQGRYDELARSFIPIVERHWGDVSLQGLSYRECMQKIYERSEREAQEFFTAYEGALVPEEFWGFVNTLKARRVPYGIMLLTFSQFLNFFVDAYEENRKEFRCVLRFALEQEHICNYEPGEGNSPDTISFGGRGLALIDNEAEVKQEIQRSMRKD